jgi:uncharacterized OB-fold protein
MTKTHSAQPIDPDVIGGTPEEPRLIGSVCARCALWSWTIQCFAPKAPPYLPGGVDEFEPYGVGYIELPGEVRVEARLTESDPERLRIGMPMELTLIPVPGAPDKLTFAFGPAGEEDE